jgi:hypothetical protein
MPILHILSYNGCLVTWTVMSLTTAKFKLIIFSMSGYTLSYTANMFILMIPYGFCLFPGKFSCIIIYIYIWKVKSCVQIADLSILPSPCKGVIRRTIEARITVYSCCNRPPYNPFARPEWKYRFQQHLYCWMRICCRGIEFTEPLPRNGSTRYNILTWWLILVFRWIR